MAGSDSSSRDIIINPGPDNRSVLHLQNFHVSEFLWNGGERNAIKIRKAQDSRLVGRQVPPQIRQILSDIGFLGVASLQSMEVNPALMIALVDRWRPETHTFHMFPGECTVTLQDVAIQLGLSIDGMPVIGSTGGNKYDIVEQCLGIRPPPVAFNGNTLKLSWLDAHFGNVEDHLQPVEQLHRYVRAYLLRLIGGFMLVDHSGSWVSVTRYLPLLYNIDRIRQYSWGVAALAHLYRELCNATNPDRSEIGGVTPLLQLWAWERFPSISPVHPPYDHNNQLPYACRWMARDVRKGLEKKVTFYRKKLDNLSREQIVWQPYSESLIERLPPICRDGMPLWRAVVPIIDFNIVEWHQPDRVMRQFVMIQHIPGPPLQPEWLHDITLRGKTDENWLEKYASVIELWKGKHVSIPQLT